MIRRKRPASRDIPHPPGRTPGSFGSRLIRSFSKSRARQICHGAQHRFQAADRGETGVGAVDTAFGQFPAFRSVETAGEKVDLQRAPLQDVDDIDAAKMAVLLFWRLWPNSSRISSANQERLAIVCFMTKSDNNS